MADEPTVRGRLGRELRKAREAAGLTQSAIAAVLGCGQGKINKIETTLVEIKPNELDVMLKSYEVPAGKAEEIRALAFECRGGRRRPGLPPNSSAFRHLSDVEVDAAELLSLHSERIPGPLQSELYMLRQFESYTDDPNNVVELLRRRRARAQVITADDPPRYRAILSESSLRRMPGGHRPELEVDQIEHLLGLIKSYDRLTVQILPFDADVPYVNPDFTIVRFDGDERDFIYIEYAVGATTLKGRKDLRELTDDWSQLHAAALRRDQTVQFLDQLKQEAQHRWQQTGGND